MSQAHVALVGLFTALLSAALSLLIANWRDSRWRNARKAEQLYYKIERLQPALYDIVRSVKNAHEATAYLQNGDARAAIEQRLCDLKNEISQHHSNLLPRFIIILSASTTTHVCLERLAAAAPEQGQAALDARAYAVANLRDSIEQFKAELLIVGRPHGFWRYLREHLPLCAQQPPGRAIRVSL
ncbi:MAG: hypothetical protein KGM15_17300 [Pseudomonadota bacterium]|nr:hypothetical protein [Pseudomonadota bacterium]